MRPLSADLMPAQTVGGRSARWVELTQSAYSHDYQNESARRPTRWAKVVSTQEIRSGAWMAGPVHRSLVAVDMEAWAGRSAPVAAEMQGAVDEALRVGLRSVGLNLAAVILQRSGDSRILALPAETPKDLITTTFLTGLEKAVRAWRSTVSPSAKPMRIRVALHSGEVLERNNEWAGPAVITLTDLVNATEGKLLLTANPSSRVLVLLSNLWHDSVVTPGFVDVQHCPIHIQGKHGEQLAWVRVIGKTRPRGLDDVLAAPPGVGQMAHPATRINAPRVSTEPGMTVGNYYRIDRPCVGEDLVLGDKIVIVRDSDEYGTSSDEH